MGYLAVKEHNLDKRILGQNNKSISSTIWKDIYTSSSIAIRFIHIRFGGCVQVLNGIFASIQIFSVKDYIQ